MRHEISDQEWLDLQFDPAGAAARGLTIPAFASDAYQRGFTGMAGRENLDQGFSFYRYARDAAGIAGIENPHILDFGIGWGRIARFWLRDTAPGNITGSDTMDLAIQLLRDLEVPYHIVQNPPYPPVDYGRQYDLIYAFSVFSHLSEKYSAAWIDHLLSILKPSGRLVITTRGNDFIQDISNVKGQTDEFILQQPPEIQDYLNQLRATFPPAEILREKYDSGELQFYYMKDARLPDDETTGETIIPRGWFEQRYGDRLVNFEEGVHLVNQAIVTLRR